MGEGADGLKKLIEKTKKHPTALWQGAVGAMTATWVGHYPWFYTNNQLRESLHEFDFAYGKYVRNATIGFASAAVSDTCSNSLRVLKTTRQTAWCRSATWSPQSRSSRQRDWRVFLVVA